MKGKIILMILVFTTALVLYVAAQNKTTTELFDTQANPLETEKGRNSSKSPVTAAPFYVSGPRVGPSGQSHSEEMVLLQAKVGVGAINYVQIIPPDPNRTVFQTGKLRIEMQDGSVQEMGLDRVKKVTIGR